MGQTWDRQSFGDLSTADDDDDDDDGGGGDDDDDDGGVNPACFCHICFGDTKGHESSSPTVVQWGKHHGGYPLIIQHSY